MQSDLAKFYSFLLQYNLPPMCIAHLLCNTTCHPSACVAVSDGHSDQCLRTLHPNTSVPALYALFVRLLQSTQSVPKSIFLTQTFYRGIIWCTKTSGFTSER